MRTVYVTDTFNPFWLDRKQQSSTAPANDLRALRAVDDPVAFLAQFISYPTHFKVEVRMTNKKLVSLFHHRLKIPVDVNFVPVKLAKGDIVLYGAYQGPLPDENHPDNLSVNSKLEWWAF